MFVITEEDRLLDVNNSELNGELRTTGKRARTFKFEELVVATDDFRPDCFVGEGGFGKVYKGMIEDIDQVINVILWSCFELSCELCGHMDC